MTRQRILFFAEAVTLAHVARPYVLACSLNPNHYNVLFASDPRFAHLFTESMATRSIHSIPSRQFTHALSKGSPIYDKNTLDKYIVEDLAVINEFTPDLIVGDFRLSLAVSAQKANIPYVTISNIYWSPYAQIHYPIPDIPLTKLLGVTLGQKVFNLARPLAFALHTQPLNKLRQQYGLPSLGMDLRNTYTWADHTVYADIPSICATHNLPSTHHFIGPVLWSASPPLPQWWNNIPQDKPIVYVSMGSSGHSQLLSLIIDTLSQMPVTVLATTAAKTQITHSAPNVYIADFLPGEKATAMASIVISNGGSPTTYQALAKGKPVLGIPHNLDQFLNMQGILHTGAGKQLRTRQVNSVTIQNTIESLLNETTFCESAKLMAQNIKSHDSNAKFNAFLAEILSKKITASTNTYF